MSQGNGKVKIELSNTVEQHFESIITVSLLTPLGDPLSEDCRWGLPAIFWGKSGIGKSDRIFAAGERVGLPVEVVYTGTKQPEDFSGAPVPTPDGIKVECILGPARELIRKGKGLLFLDEMSCAAPAVQGACLSMVNERRVGDEKLPPGVRILLAANPPEFAAGGWDLEAPMANRMAHFSVASPSVNDWTNWLMSEQSQRDEPIEQAEEKIKAGWNHHWPMIKGMLAGYMRDRQSSLHIQPDPDNPQSGRAWPSPRTWWMAGRAVAAIRCLGMAQELESYFVEGCVGEGEAAGWLEWAHNANLPSPEDVLNDGWTPDTKRLDRTFAVYTSIISFVLSVQDKEEKYDYAAKAWDRLFDLSQAKMSDIGLGPAQQLLNAKLARKGTPKHVKLAAEKFLLEAGQSGIVRYFADA